MSVRHAARGRSRGASACLQQPGRAGGVVGGIVRPGGAASAWGPCSRAVLCVLSRTGWARGRWGRRAAGWRPWSGRRWRRRGGRRGGQVCAAGGHTQRLREVCHAVLWCTFLCMDCAGGRCGRGWRGERPSRDLRERASHRAAAKRACCERRIVGTQELLAALPSCTRSACRAHADTCTCVTVRDRGAREYGRLRAPRTGVLDLEAARSYLPILSASNLCTQLYVLHAANSA